MFFATPAFAQTPGAGGFSPDMFGPFVLPLALIVLFYFMILRPQQKRQKEHQNMIAAVKRGDTVVLSSGILGKVTGVGETEVTVEIAPGVPVKVIKAQIQDVRVKGEPAPANDTKS